MRFKRGGGLAGHNGLKSLDACLGSREFPRLRLGVDKPQDPDQIVTYVTSRFKPVELPVLEKILPAAVAALLLYMEQGLTPAMQEVNGIDFSLKPEVGA